MDLIGLTQDRNSGLTSSGLSSSAQLHIVSYLVSKCISL
jgi:hypothetical protein